MKKKIFFLSSVALLAASCTNEIIEEGPAQNGAVKGISFKMAEGDETRGMVTDEYKSFFYAELDRVGIYADKVKKDGTDVTNYGTMATYKATKSTGNPLLTGIADDEILSYWSSYANNQSASFFIVYPKDATVTYAADKFTITPSVNLAAQSMSTDGTMNFDSRLMFDYITGMKPQYSYNSVGETLEMNLTSPLSMLYFSFQDIKNYPAFGMLSTITLNATGAKYTKDGNEVAVEGSPLTFGTDASVVVAADETYTVNNGTDPGKEIVLTVNKAIENGAKQNMFTLTKTAKIKDGDKTYDLTDSYKITYKFANVDLVYNKKASSAAWVANAAYGMPSADGLSIANEFPYIVTRGTKNSDGTPKNDRVLYINKGKVTDIDDKDSKVINWTDANTFYKKTPEAAAATENFVAFTEIQEIIVNDGADVLTAEDWAVIGKMTNVKTIKVLNSTKEVHKDKLDDLNKLTYIDMQNVTILHETSFKGASLQTVKLPSFDFSVSRAVTEAILKPGSLQVLDMSGTKSMKQEFPKEGMTLMNYDQLTTVTVQDGVVLGPEAFRGCTALTTVNGYVKLGGYGAFQGCTDLTTIKIDESTKIYDNTFLDATSLAEVKSSTGGALTPATIGVSAFENTKVNVDLTASVTIGANAFKGNKALKGAKPEGKNLFCLEVAAQTVGVDAFYGCTALEYVKFTNLNTVEAGILAGTTLKELKFANVVSFANGVNSATFGTPLQTTLFIHEDQAYVAKKLTISKSVSVEFNTIVEE